MYKLAPANELCCSQLNVRNEQGMPGFKSCTTTQPQSVFLTNPKRLSGGENWGDGKNKCTLMSRVEREKLSKINKSYVSNILPEATSPLWACAFSLSPYHPDPVTGIIF